MPKYHILMNEQQAVTYEVNAPDEVSARELVYTDGEKIDSKNLECMICEVNKVKE